MKDALVFSHANGFPAPVYRVMLQALGERFAVSAVACYGHDARYPVGPGWPGLVVQLQDHIAASVSPGARLWLVGHSMGGYLSVLAARALGMRVRGVVLLDSPLIDGFSAHVVKLGRRTGLDRHLMPLEQTLQRRREWPDVDAVLRHFHDKPAFSAWDARTLRDYAEHGTRECASGRELRVDPDVEHAIYRSLPTRSVALAARSLRCPVAFLGGTRSREIRGIGLRATRACVGGRLGWIEGGHLFPMERPDDTAARTVDMIDGMEAALAQSEPDAGAA